MFALAASLEGILVRILTYMYGSISAMSIALGNTIYMVIARRITRYITIPISITAIILVLAAVAVLVKISISGLFSVISLPSYLQAAVQYIMPVHTPLFITALVGGKAALTAANILMHQIKYLRQSI